MRIAMMTNNYRPVVGGVPISIDRLSDGLRARGHEVTVFAPCHEGQVFEPDVVRFRSHDANLPANAMLPDIFDPAIEANFRMGGFDIIHIHHPMLIGYNGLHLSRKYGVPLAFTYHTQYEQFLHCARPYAALERRASPDGGILQATCDSIKQLVRFHNRTVANHCDLIFAPTPQIRQELLNRDITSPIEVMATGLAREDFTYDAAVSDRIRKRYLTGRESLFCSVARLSGEKNIPFLLKALARYKADGRSFRLLLIGDGPERENLESCAADLGLGNDVVFVGSVPHSDISNYYRACDVFVFTSKSETQGIVLLEAMAAGLPVVAVDACGVCDVVVNNHNGYRVMESDSQFAAALAAITGDGLLFACMREGARSTAGRHTAEEMALTAERAYQRMLRTAAQPNFAYTTRGRYTAAD